MVEMDKEKTETVCLYCGPHKNIGLGARVILPSAEKCPECCNWMDKIVVDNKE